MQKIRPKPSIYPKRVTGLVSPSGASLHRPKVVVAYPAGGSVTVPFHESMQRLLLYEMVKPDEQRELSDLAVISGLYIAQNRNVLARRLLSTDAEWLLQIDTDIEFPATILETLLHLAGHDKKVLAASVPLGTAVIHGNSAHSAGYRKGFPSCAFTCDGPGVWSSLAEVPTTPIEVDGVATAVILTHRSVFEEIARRGGQVWFDHIYEPVGQPTGDDWSDVQSISIGEDISFCVRARVAGFKVWCVQIPGLKHWKTAPQTHDLEPELQEAAI